MVLLKKNKFKNNNIEFIGEVDRLDLIKYYNKSYLLIENHENLNLSNKKKVKQFFKILKNNFHILRIKQNGKNPFAINSIENFDEDLKWLAMSECRPTNQDWLLCKPKRR